MKEGAGVGTGNEKSDFAESELQGHRTGFKDENETCTNRVFPST